MKEWVPMSVFVAVIWGSMPHISKYITNGNPSIVYVALRTVCEVLVVGTVALILIRRQGVKVERPKRLLWVPLAALGSSLSVLIFVFSLTKNKASTAVSFTYPLSLIVSLAVGHVIAHEKLTQKEMLGVAVSIVACILLN